MVILDKKTHFIGKFERGGIILLGRGWQSFLIYVQSYACLWLEFHFMVHARLGGLVV